MDSDQRNESSHKAALGRVIYVAALAIALGASAAAAQNVAYHGKLQIGFGDQDNVTGFRSNSAIPICAGAGPLVNPGTVGTTLGTLWVNALGSATPGVGGSLTFNAVGGGVGGAQQKKTSTCRTTLQPGVNIRLRSRTQVGSAHFPGRKGAHTSMITSASIPFPPNATYMLSAGGGNAQAAPTITWTTKASFNAPTVTYSGPALSATIPYFGPGLGVARIQPGPNRFGGGVPYSGGGGVQLGIYFTSMLPPQPVGNVIYVNGFLPQGPNFFGTDAKGIAVPNPLTTSIYTSNLTFTLGLIAGRQDVYTFAARTPGGSTIDQQGAIRTLAGGNTVTPHTSCTGGVPCAPPIISPVAGTGAYFEWTTGAVTHTDKIGDFSTIRKASGYDIAVAPSTAVAGETRRIQLVSPWSATVRPIGPFGLPVANLGYGGIAVLTLNVIPQLDDMDGDLVADAVDNCEVRANGPNEESNQIDTDQDGFGNACDTDYNNDGFTTTLDFPIYLAAFTGLVEDPSTDHTGDGLTTTVDFTRFFLDFSQRNSPGPSGLTCAGGAPPCLP